MSVNFAHVSESLFASPPHTILPVLVHVLFFLLEMYIHCTCLLHPVFYLLHSLLSIFYLTAEICGGICIHQQPTKGVPWMKKKKEILSTNAEVYWKL